MWLMSGIEGDVKCWVCRWTFRVVRYMVESVLLMRVNVDVLAIL